MEALLWDRSSGVDDPGKKEVDVEFYDNADAFVGEKTTSFYLYEGDPDAKDTTECCDDCDEPYFSLHEW